MFRTDGRAAVVAEGVVWACWLVLLPVVVWMLFSKRKLGGRLKSGFCDFLRIFSGREATTARSGTVFVGSYDYNSSLAASTIIKTRHIEISVAP
jgi:hypothetical protein